MIPDSLAEEMISRYVDLLAGRSDGMQASHWARQQIGLIGPQVDEEDPILHALDCLAAADRRTADGHDLYTEDDFKGWLFVLQAKGPSGH